MQHATYIIFISPVKHARYIHLYHLWNDVKKKFAKKKKKNVTEKNEKKKNWAKINLGKKKKFGLKKNLSNKNLGKKKIAQYFEDGDILKLCTQSKFEAKRLKIALFIPERPFWDPKLAHFRRPILGQS